MHPPPDPVKCKSCTAMAEDGQVRCREHHKAFRAWLDGGYVPQWDGVVNAPSDADDPRSSYDRALMKRKEGQ